MADVNISTSSKIETNLLSDDTEVMIIDDDPLQSENSNVESREILDASLFSIQHKDVDTSERNVCSSQNVINLDDNSQEVIEINDSLSQEVSVEAPKCDLVDITCDTPASPDEIDLQCETIMKKHTDIKIELIYGDISPEVEEENEKKDVLEESSKAVTLEYNSIEIKFSNAELFSKYKEKFVGFLNTLTELKFVEEGNKLIYDEKSMNDMRSKCEVVNNPEEIDLDEYEEDPTNKKRKRREIDRRKEKDRKEENLFSRKEDNLFSIDTEPSSDGANSNLTYMSKYKVIDDDPEAEEETKEKEPPRISCFNCYGDHVLRDCPIPRDQNRIKGNRHKLKPHSIQVRYHEGNVETKYGHLKPGVLTSRLREALGLRKHEIPAHVYKMRVMGYPPGYIEAAKVLNSNLVLFDSEGKEHKPKLGANFTLDPNKIIDYPGFNCPLPRGAQDDYRYFCVPPYSSALCKENMLDFFQTVQPELDNNSRKLRSPSPTLVDLEAKKKALLQQLTCNDDSNTASALDLDLSTEQLSPENGNVSFDLDKTTESISSDDALTPPKKDQPILSKINSSSAGTPIIKPLSPYSRLPNLDKFQKDVSPVINFENLPNSTGKYEQMTSVLVKVRNMMKSRTST